MGQRLGCVPAALRAAVAGRHVVWVHAVSVGEVLAATRLIAELEEELGAGWVVVVSTTTATGQTLARERFGAGRIFYYPLDFARAVRAYLRVLQPKLLVLMESELWPRMLVECGRTGVPVAVVNARVSDRSYARGLKVRAIWGRVLRRVNQFLAQSEEDARRLVAMGARAEAVRAIGNLKYDVRVVGENRMARRIGEMRGASRVIVAGSTLANEEEMLLSAWPRILRGGPDMILVIAPRHPERFQEVYRLIEQSGNVAILCSQLDRMSGKLSGGTILLLDTIGDLASVYSVASAAFIGGSLVPKGGHNPLEAARFGVPVVIGESFENFRDIVEGLKNAWAIRIVKEEQLAESLIDAPRYAQKSGERGREFYMSQIGATGRAVAALMGMVRDEARR
jgi:3-deoxy-D-manno-octulosonic-acid transferase